MSKSNSYVENEVEKFNHPIDIYNDSSQSNAKSLDISRNKRFKNK